jgi:hypothetical protein
MQNLDGQPVQLEVYRAVTQLFGGNAQLVQNSQVHVGNRRIHAGCGDQEFNGLTMLLRAECVPPSK